VHHKLTFDLRDRKIPFSQNIDLTDFLADVGTIGDWNMAGLPTDPLSIQNGILVTRSTRFPLLIDPQVGVQFTRITSFYPLVPNLVYSPRTHKR
jgi:dynein heavy chain